MIRKGLFWVTDFGLATIIEAGSCDQADEVAGTLRYMAPEHIGGKQDARSDIYSLGLTLYELLTKEPAFDAPSRPSLVSKIMSGCLLPPRAIRSQIPRDLEAIVLKATAKHPDGRYETADAMAADLLRFVDGRSVSARRVGPIVRLTRWTRRNPTVAMLTAALLVLAICSFGMISSKWRDAVAENQRAEENLSLALESMDQILEEFGSSWMAHPEATETAVAPDSTTEVGIQIAVSDHSARVLQNALVFYDRFAQQNPTNPKLYYEMSKVHRRVGDIYQRLGQHDRAEIAYRRSLSSFESKPGGRDLELTLEHANTRNQLGLSLYAASRFEESRFEFNAAIRELNSSPHGKDPECRAEKARTLTNLAQCLSLMCRQREALKCQQQAVEIIETILAEQETKNNSHRLALALAYRGYFRLASFQRRTRHSPSNDELERIRNSGVRILEQLVAEYPTVPDYRCELSDALVTTGFLSPRDSMREQLISDIQRGMNLARQLTHDHPSIPRYRVILAKALTSLARIQRENRPAESEVLLNESIVLYRSLTREFEDIPAYRLFLVWALSDHIDSLRSMGRAREALPLIQDAIDEQKVYLELRPGNRFGKIRLGHLHKKLAEVYDDLQEDVKADAAWQEAGKLLRMQFGRGPLS